VTPVLNRLDAACRGADWHDSARFRCLGFEFTVRSNDAWLVDHVSALYAACRAPGTPKHSFILRRHGARPSAVTVYRDGRAVRRHAAAGLAVAHLAWEVNRGVVQHADGRLLLHAAAAERDGTVVLLTGPAGTGKSTLVAALVAAGLRYVTDEVVAIDCHTGLIETYPKPIGLGRGVVVSDSVFGPGRDGEFLDLGLDEVLVPPQSIRTDTVAPAGGIPRVVVLPRYRPDAPTAARPVSRAEALVALAEQAFNFRELSPGALDVVARVVRASRCYRLEFGDLASARDVTLDLLESMVGYS
jgi:hypothetical protein